MRSFDLIVIGGGSAGTAAVLTARRAGAANVAVIERDQLGGDCPARACVPTKALLASVARYRSARASAAFGVVGAVRLDWSRAMARKDAVVRDLLADDARLYADAGVTVLRGNARFVGELEIDVAGERVQGERIVIATGSRPSVPDLPGLREHSITSVDAVSLAELPRRVFILGGGVVGVEFAQLFASAGASVILADRGPHLVDVEDVHVADAVLADLREQGVDIRTRVSLLSVTRHASETTVTLDDGTSHVVDTVLAATGRLPAIDTLALETTGVAVTSHGVTTDAQLRTTHEHIFAAGDARGELLYTHVAAYEGTIAARNALRDMPESVELSAIPRIAFTDPPIAGVGLGEGAARERGLEPMVVSGEIGEIGRARIEAARGGALALIADAHTKRLLGASLWGPQADSVIHEIAALIRMGAAAPDLARMIHAYPSWNDALTGAAAALL